MSVVPASETVERTEDQSLKARIPLATYRVQLNKQFTFQQARAIVEYLHALGVSDLYTSPFFKARVESTHGYDIADHNAFNPAIGSDDDFNNLAAALQARGMGLLADTVPNHMGIGEPVNEWWMDVLENGPSSRYALFFDIDWHPIKDELENRVLLPILGQQYGRVLESQELQLRYEDGAFFLYYYETCLPVNPRSYAEILQIKVDELTERLGNENEHLLEYLSILTAMRNLPPRNETDPQRVTERGREKEIIKRRLDVLYTASAEVRAALDDAVRILNGVPGDPRSFDLLDALIERQAYRLAYWRVASEEINYRRFFDVNDLAGIRMERDEVFEATHRMLMRLLAEGKVTGVRLDHPDGLYDPASYFQRLQEAYVAARRATTDGQPSTNGADGSQEEVSASIDSRQPPLYVLVEKILGHGEITPEEWPVYGTTGYDFMNELNGIFVDGTAERRFNVIYSDFTSLKLRFDDLVYETRKQIMRISLASELNVLTYVLNRVSEHNRYYRDFTMSSMRDALREVIANFPVYRTYIVAQTDLVEERDRQIIEMAVARARRRNPAVDPSIYDFIRDILLLRYPDTPDPAAREEQRNFVMKFQQLTGPVMAKGLEDTAFYIFNRLTSLNEVGGEPKYFGTTVSAFHRKNHERLRDWPFSMLSTSTHDTKRSEDVRARINVLSELPDAWRKALTRWSRLNRRKKTEVEDKLAPDRNEEYLLYQAILGTLPLEPMSDEERKTYVERIQNYMTKATREAKVNTSWLSTNNEWDKAVQRFVAAILNDQRFLDDARELNRMVVHFGVYNSLAQTMLKLTAPGVPDIYQGQEMFDYSLVDPDNRRPVDYQLRQYLLREMQNYSGSPSELARTLSNSSDNRSKLFVTYNVLNYRRDHADLFRHGTYTALTATGDASDHIVAFARAHGDERMIVVVPRLLAKKFGELTLPIGKQAWGDAVLELPASLANGRYRNVLTGEMVELVERDGSSGLALAQVFANFPVALLEVA